MKLKKLTLNNFLSWRDAEIDLSNYSGACLITGQWVGGQIDESNASGKSSILEAIGWVLFGESRARIDDELINDNADKMSVMLDFEMDGKAYDVIKSRTRGGSNKLMFRKVATSTEKVLNYTGNSVKETQARIVEELGMDYELWVNTVWARQGELDNFPQRTPTERKDIFVKMLSIEQYADWEEKAKGLADTFGRDIQSLELVVQRNEGDLVQELVTAVEIEIATQSLAGAQEEVVALKESLKIAQAEHITMSGQLRLNAQIRESIETDQKRLDRVKVQTDYQNGELKRGLEAIRLEKVQLENTIGTEAHIVSVIVEIKGKLEDFDQLKLKMERYKEESIALQKETDDTERRIPPLEEELAKLRKQLETVQDLDARCPICFSEITQEKKVEIESEIVAIGKTRKAELDCMGIRNQEISVRLKEITQAMRDIGYSAGRQSELQRELDKGNERLLGVETAKSKLGYTGEREQKVVADYNVRIAELENEQKEVLAHSKVLEAQLVDDSILMQNVRVVEGKINSMELRLGEVTKKKEDAVSSLNVLISKKETWEKKRKQVDIDKSKLESLKGEQFVYSELAKAFGKKGIPALIIDNALAEIQSEVKARLDKLTGGRIKVSFSTERETQDKGKKTETLDILVDDGSKVKDYRLYSGGEKVRVAIAIRLALAKIISRRSGKQIRCIGIDEIPDLDGAGMRSFVADINEVAKEYDQIFVVSHIQELKDQFSSRLHVIRDSEGSRVA